MLYNTHNNRFILEDPVENFGNLQQVVGKAGKLEVDGSFEFRWMGRTLPTKAGLEQDLDSFEYDKAPRRFEVTILDAKQKTVKVRRTQ